MAAFWRFDGFDFPAADSPLRGRSGDWNRKEKLVEHEPINAGHTVLVSWGFTSGRRTISGICTQLTRDTLITKWENSDEGSLIDAEGRNVIARIIDAKFDTIIPGERYNYTLTFMER